jgi:hypothetical protein
LLPEIVTVVPPLIDPLFGEISEMVGAGADDMLRENPADEEDALASCTCEVNEELPAIVGVPVIMPVEEFSCRPVGSVPLVVLHV